MHKYIHKYIAMSIIKLKYKQELSNQNEAFPQKNKNKK